MLTRFLISLIPALVLNTLTIQAQELEAEIPFVFQAGRRTLPAGQYHIDVDQSGLVWITGSRPEQQAVVGTIGVGVPEPRHQSALVFNRYADLYFLHEIRSTEYSTGRQVPLTRMEEEIAKSRRSSATTLPVRQR